MTVALRPDAGPRNEQIALARCVIPDFGSVDALPLIPQETYAARADALVSRAGKDWVVVYADR